MENILNDMNKLRLGLSKSGYPIYAQSIFSDSKTVSTSNDEAYVKLNYSLPFTGEVNAFVLEKLLKSSSSEEDVEWVQSGSMLFLKSSSLNAELPLTDSDFPIMEVNDSLSYIKVTDALYDTIKLAFKYVDKSGIYSHVYVAPNGVVLSGASSRAFMSRVDVEGGGSPILLNKKVFSTLSVGDKVAIDESGILNIKYSNGFALVSVDNPEQFKYDLMSSFVMDSVANDVMVADSLRVVEMTKRVLPLLEGELEKVVSLVASHNKLSVHAVSAMNGKADTTTNVEFDGELSIDVDVANLVSVSSDYNMMYNDQFPDRLIFESVIDESIIVFLGRKSI